MFKFSKKIVSLASSLLALTSLAGSAKAMDAHVNPYQHYMPVFDYDFAGKDGNTFMNAVKATQEEYDEYMKNLDEDDQRFIRDKIYFAANRISNHPKTAIGATVGIASLIAAYKFGAFDGLLGKNRNKKHVKAYFNNNNFDDEDDYDDEDTDDNESNQDY